MEEVIEEQIINLKVKGDWEIEQISRTGTLTKYHLKNAQEINNAFTKMAESYLVLTVLDCWIISCLHVQYYSIFGIC